MKKLRTIMCVMTISFLGITSSYAQEKTTVLVKAAIFDENMYVINTVKPDNTTYELKNFKNKDEDALVVLKQELDKWVLEGYKLINSTTISYNGSTANKTIYYFMKD